MEDIVQILKKKKKNKQEKYKRKIKLLRLMKIIVKAGIIKYKRSIF